MVSGFRVYDNLRNRIQFKLPNVYIKTTFVFKIRDAIWVFSFRNKKSAFGVFLLQPTSCS